MEARTSLSHTACRIPLYINEANSNMLFFFFISLFLHKVYHHSSFFLRYLCWFLKPSDIDYLLSIFYCYYFLAQLLSVFWHFAFSWLFNSGILHYHSFSLHLPEFSLLSEKNIKKTFCDRLVYEYIPQSNVLLEFSTWCG